MHFYNLKISCIYGMIAVPFPTGPLFFSAGLGPSLWRNQATTEGLRLGSSFRLGLGLGAGLCLGTRQCRKLLCCLGTAGFGPCTTGACHSYPFVRFPSLLVYCGGVNRLGQENKKHIRKQQCTMHHRETMRNFFTPSLF